MGDRDMLTLDTPYGFLMCSLMANVVPETTNSARSRGFQRWCSDRTKAWKPKRCSFATSLVAIVGLLNLVVQNAGMGNSCQTETSNKNLDNPKGALSLCADKTGGRLKIILQKRRKMSKRKNRSEREEGVDRKTERENEGAHKGFGFGPVPWWGVVWKEERLWERNTTPQNASVSFAFTYPPPTHTHHHLFLFTFLCFCNWPPNISCMCTTNFVLYIKCMCACVCVERIMHVGWGLIKLHGFLFAPLSQLEKKTWQSSYGVTSAPKSRPYNNLNTLTCTCTHCYHTCIHEAEAYV